MHRMRSGQGRRWLLHSCLMGMLAFLKAYHASADASADAGAVDQELVINSMHSDPNAKKAFNDVLALFKQANPDIKVIVNTVDHESYKVQIRTWLPSSPPDIATWFAGDRASYFIEKGLIEPIDDVWAPIRDQFAPATREVVSFNGRPYMMPTTYYNWGLYYRRDLFAKAGIKVPPKTWDEFIDVIQKLKAIGIRPITIGTRNGWPAAGWFGYLTLRVHGYEFYTQLMRGKIKYTDARVRQIFERWAELVKLGAFPKNAPALTWQEAAAMLWQGRAAMYLMGNFMTGEIPANVEDQIDFFPFPKIGQSESVELAPTDVYFIPAKARHKDTAKRFLKFVATARAQEVINAPAHQLATNLQASMAGADRFQKQGFNLLSSATHLTQFFDRDANPELATAGMDGFVEFMAYPERLDAILARLERTRSRVHK